MTAKKKNPPAPRESQVQPASAIDPVLKEFIERDEFGEQKSDINYSTLLTLGPKPRELSEEEAEQAAKIVFYCCDCKALRETEKHEKGKLKFKCKECKGDHIYFGTELGIKKFFHLTK